VKRIVPIGTNRKLHYCCGQTEEDEMDKQDEKYVQNLSLKP
jgi:hypothetical protein